MYDFSITENVDFTYVDVEPTDWEILNSNLEMLQGSIENCDNTTSIELLESLLEFINSTKFDELDTEIERLKKELETAYQDGDFIECGIIIRRILRITEDMIDDN